MKWLWLGILLLGMWCTPASAQYLWCMDVDVITAEVEGSTVTIFHEAALYNCCWNPFEYITFWEDGRLVVVEDEILVNGCWCQCCYNLSVQIQDVPPGEQIVVFRWYNEESNDWVEVELEIFVANDDHPQQDPLTDKASVGPYTQTPCLDAAASVPDEPVGQPVSWGTLKARYHR